jgi:hypothetical protein
MKYPDFFTSIEPITLRDDLSQFLGIFEDGVMEFNYLDIVKSAGHSCPTVAGAYLMAQAGLKALYKDELPKRGEVFVAFKEDCHDGVAGVIANVFAQITGATEQFGFKGIGGNYVRHDLMKFNADITSDVKLQRLDTGETVEVIYNPSSIGINPLQPRLMEKILKETATQDDKILFGKIWQERVAEIFKNKEKVITIK